MLRVVVASVALLALANVEPAEARPHHRPFRSSARMHRKVIRHRHGHHGRHFSRYHHHRHHRFHARAPRRANSPLNADTFLDWTTRYFDTYQDASDYADQKRNEGATVAGPFEYADGYLVRYSFSS